MPRACVLLRSSDHYRADVFRSGLHRHGFTIDDNWQRRPAREDALLLWNRSRGNEAIAEIYERAGARVLIAENGYIPRRDDGAKYYALALGHHNGAGRWHVGDAPRFPIWEQPWQAKSESRKHIVVLPQRGIGAAGVKMPGGWLEGVKRRLAAITDRPIVVRPHPGAEKSSPDEVLRDAHCAVTWGSGAAIRAIQLGVPVFHELEQWIGAPGATRLAGQIEDCHTPDRRVLWTRVSWAQWLLDEIATGEAFERLLHAEDRDLFRT